ncbi:MAG: 2-amino-4-hydroxy-6-hydroxymethyldihydropteridine diphosphokinase [Kordiimonadaceae bacterium]|nr:2-amino-4-hydroxy-6-hydroxymethyldihydropteridine diphosphokinase [Kordiimonadaceae bacterium]
MILIGLGSNLTTEEFSSSKAILMAAVDALSEYDIEVIKISNFYETEPVPKSDQPWFVNAVISIETHYDALELLGILHEIERNMGRVRKEKWEARIIDLDLLSYNDEIYPDPENWHKVREDIASKLPIIPHGRLHERDFVLIPMADISTDWKHPVFNKSVKNMLKAHNSEGIVRIL